MLYKTPCSLILVLGLTSTVALAAPHAVAVGPGGTLTFSPATLNIAAGDTVTFSSDGTGFHNVASDAGAVTTFRCANGCDGAGGNGAPSGAAWTATVTFATPGTIGYHCEVHQGLGMVGTINVTVPVDLQSFEID